MSGDGLFIDLEAISPVLLWAGREKYPNGISVGPRTLPYFEIIYFHQGRGRVYFGNTAFDFSQGDLFVVPAHQEHRYLSEAMLIDHDYLCFSMKSHEQLQGPRKRKPENQRGLSKSRWVELPFKVSGSHAKLPELLQELLDSIKAKKSVDDDASVLVRKRMMLELFELILTTRSRKDSQEPFAKSRKYIERHLSAKISVRLLASLEGLTPNYFGNRFLRIFGVSPQGYLLERRINQARHLLWEGKKVNEVARLTGPWDAFYFSRMFKSRTGFSPKEYSRLLSR